MNFLTQLSGRVVVASRRSYWFYRYPDIVYGDSKQDSPKKGWSFKSQALPFFAGESVYSMDRQAI